jgi:hypothetical protein
MLLVDILLEVFYGKFHSKMSTNNMEFITASIKARLRIPLPATQPQDI